MEDKNSANDIFRIVAWIAGTMMVLAIAMCGVGSGGGPRATAAPMALAVSTGTADLYVQDRHVNGSSLVLGMNSSLDTNSVPASTDFTLKVNQETQPTPTAVTIDGSNLTLTLAQPVNHGDYVELSYTEGAAPIQDTLGNRLGSFSSMYIDNRTPDTTPPTLKSATVDGSLLYLTYHEYIDSYSIPTTSQFGVSVTTSTGDTTQPSVTGSAIKTDMVTLTLSSPVQFGDGPITVSYTPVDGSTPIQDRAGNDAGPLSNEAVTNLTGATTLTGTTASTGSISTDPVTGDVSVTMPWGSRSDLTISSQVACSNGATPSNVGLVHNSKTYPMTGPDASGQYTGTIPGSELTTGDITIAFDCGTEPISDTVGTIQLYDPSGIISDAVSGQPVVGAKVTLYKVPGWEPETDCETMDTRDSTGGPGWDQPAPTELGVVADPASGEISPRLNPQYTNSIGYYGWDVARGCWYVTVEKAGYKSLTSPVVGVPPAVLDLDLKLTPQYELKGFYSPVDMGGTKNTAKAGATIPLKFEVFQGGTELTDTSVVQSVGYKASSACGATTAADTIETLTDTTGLRYDTTSGQFVYGWKTPKQSGCYDVTATMTDGSQLTALFELK